MKILFPRSDYVVFDFETTGFDANKDDVIQMSAQRRLLSGETVKFNKYIKINRPLDPKITQLTGITDKLLNEQGVSPIEAWLQFKDFIAGFPLIGHNCINFDRKFLEKSYQLMNFQPPSYKWYIDTAMIYKAMKLNAHQKYFESHFDFCCRISETRAAGVYFRLTLACQEMGIDISHLTAHRSDADVEMTNLLYCKFLDMFS